MAAQLGDRPPQWKPGVGREVAQGLQAGRRGSAAARGPLPAPAAGVLRPLCTEPGGRRCGPRGPRPFVSSQSDMASARSQPSPLLHSHPH